MPPEPIMIHQAEGFTIRRSKVYALLLGLSFIALVIYLSIADRTASSLRNLLASIITVVGAVPAFLYLWRGYDETLPLFPLHGLFYSLSFGIPAFFPEWHSRPPDGQYFISALWATAGGLACLFAAYYGIGRILFERLRPFRIRWSFSRAALVRVGWIFELTYLFWRIVSGYYKISIPTFDQLMPVIGWFGMGVLLYRLFQGNMKRTESLLLFLFIFPLEFAERLASGALAQIFFLFVFATIIFVNIRKRIQLFSLVFIIIALILFQPVKDIYRSFVKGDGDSSVGTIFSKSLLFLDLGKEYYMIPSNYVYVARGSISRFNHIGTLAAVMEQTPKMIPYFGGDTYKNLLYSWVPRILWPEKPRSTFGNEWAKPYGLLHPDDDVTSQNLPWLPEFYMNFGYPGIFVGMALVGLAFRFIGRIFDSGISSPVEFLMGFSLTIQLWFAESNLALMWGGLITLFIALYIILRIALSHEVQSRLFLTRSYVAAGEKGG